MAKQKFSLNRITTSKKILIIAAIAFSLVISVVGLRIVNAMVQPEYKDTGASEQHSKSNDTVKGKDAEAAVNAEAEAKVAEQKKQEASAKEATVAAATAEAQQAASQAQAASQIVSPAPKAKALYVDSASKVGQPSEISSQATSVWLGNWSGNERQNVNATVSKAAAQGKIASFVMYYIQNRDCGDWSQGGATSSAAYQAWVLVTAKRLSL
jgi:regulator of protease activity HflC (stomatin/prohibitin superfamily)